MSRVYNLTNLPIDYELLSQTPPNYVQDNYFLQQNQEKVDADWECRPNRALIEQETTLGTDQYSALEVVVQSVKGDTNNTVISDDWRRLVFRNTFYKCPLGIKFKFSYNFNINESDQDKSIWLASNRNTASPTGSIVVVRCNGTLGSTYTDSQGITHNHYEPVIQTKDLHTASLFYNAAAVVQNSDLTCIVQHNSYTRNYYVNQRFIVGYDRVYRIKSISKFASNRTWVPDDLGTIILYMEIVEKSANDDFINRIAYNQKEEVNIIETQGSTSDYRIKFVLPEEFPNNLTSTPIKFKPILYINDETSTTVIETSLQLMNASTPPVPVSTEILNKYVDMQFDNNDLNAFTLTRKAFYAGGALIVTCKIDAEDSPTGQEIVSTFNLSLRGL